MDRPVAIGVDLGGTRVRAAIISSAGVLLERIEQATRKTEGPHAIVDQIADMANSLVARAGTRMVAGIGICSPGPLDTETGLVLSVPTIQGFTDFPLLNELQSRLPWPVHLENDGIAATLGEWRFGAGRAVENMVYVTISTGIGGGAVVDGSLLRGRRGMAGHVGHMVIAMEGRNCPCGNRGCWEAYASGTAFSAIAEENGYQDGIEAIDAARSGNEAALELVRHLAHQLGVGIVNLAHLFSPKKIILGGGVMNAFDLLEPGIQEYLANTAMVPFRGVEVEKARLGDNSGVFGMAELVFLSNAYSMLGEASE